MREQNEEDSTFKQPFEFHSYAICVRNLKILSQCIGTIRSGEQHKIKYVLVCFWVNYIKKASFKRKKEYTTMPYTQINIFAPHVRIQNLYISHSASNRFQISSHSPIFRFQCNLDMLQLDQQ